MNRRHFIKAAFAFVAAALAPYKPSLGGGLFRPGEGPWEDGRGGVWYIALDDIGAGVFVELADGSADQVRTHTGRDPLPAEAPPRSPEPKASIWDNRYAPFGVAVTAARAGDLVMVKRKGVADVLAEMVAEVLPLLNEQFATWRPLSDRLRWK